MTKYRYTWVDPPSGWRYGFPKDYTFVPSSTTLSAGDEEDEFCAWLEANGYPIERLGRWNLNYMRYGLEHNGTVQPIGFVHFPDKRVKNGKQTTRRSIR